MITTPSYHHSTRVRCSTSVSNVRVLSERAHEVKNSFFAYLIYSGNYSVFTADLILSRVLFPRYRAPIVVVSADGSTTVCDTNSAMG